MSTPTYWGIGDACEVAAADVQDRPRAGAGEDAADERLLLGARRAARADPGAAGGVVAIARVPEHSVVEAVGAVPERLCGDGCLLRRWVARHDRRVGRQRTGKDLGAGQGESERAFSVGRGDERVSPRRAEPCRDLTSDEEDAGIVTIGAGRQEGERRAVRQCFEVTGHAEAGREREEIAGLVGVEERREQRGIRHVGHGGIHDLEDDAPVGEALRRRSRDRLPEVGDAIGGFERDAGRVHRLEEPQRLAPFRVAPSDDGGDDGAGDGAHRSGEYTEPSRARPITVRFHVLRTRFEYGCSAHRALEPDLKPHSFWPRDPTHRFLGSHESARNCASKSQFGGTPPRQEAWAPDGQSRR